MRRSELARRFDSCVVASWMSKSAGGTSTATPIEQRMSGHIVSGIAHTRACNQRRGANARTCAASASLSALTPSQNASNVPRRPAARTSQNAPYGTSTNLEMTWNIRIRMTSPRRQLRCAAIRHEHERE